MSITIGDFSDINSESMKIVLAYYYIYYLCFPYVCTEFRFMDVCACDGDYLVEIECKVSKSDLKQEKRRKKDKHKIYAGKRENISKTIPNKYYVALPYKLWLDKECETIINKLNEKYGIMVIYENKPIPEIVKEAQNLHNKKVTKKTIEKIVLRLSRENVSLRMKLYEERHINKKA